jgi:hypothetical protein
VLKAMSEPKEASFFEEPVDFGRPIITRGRVFSFPLRSSIRKSDIGAGNCPSIVWDRQNSSFYGLVIGEESHIFLFDSNSTVEDIGGIKGIRAQSGFLVFDGAEHLLCCLTDDADTHLFLHPVAQERRMYSHMWGHFSFGPIEPLGDPLKGEKALAGLLNAADRSIYVLTGSGGLFRLDAEKRCPEKVASLNPHNLSPVLCADPATGDLYGVSGRGRLWRYGRGGVQFLEAQVPVMKNRDYAALASCLVWQGRSMFGSTLQDAYLFEFKADEGTMRNLGRPDENTEIRGIDIMPDGRIFGISATRDRGMGHIFCYSQKRGFADLGVIHGWQPINDFAYEPLCIRAGGSGDFLIGNGERRSSIFLYCSSPEE